MIFYFPVNLIITILMGVLYLLLWQHVKAIELSLRNCSLQGTNPESNNMSSIAYIYLSLNQLNSSIRKGALSVNITTTDLSNNNLNRTIHPSFSALPCLQKLDFENNMFSDISGIPLTQQNVSVKCRLHRKNKAYLVMPALPKEFPVTISWKYKSSQDRKIQCYLTEGWKYFAEQHQIEEGQKLRFTITGHKEDSVNITIIKSHSA